VAIGGAACEHYSELSEARSPIAFFDGKLRPQQQWLRQRLGSIAMYLEHRKSFQLAIGKR